ncbi:MAG: methyltransferase domain-containing protein, partial [Candidatus Zixiibacteriota bacterium]
SSNGGLVKKYQLIEAINKIARTLESSRNRKGIWETEYACANLFILDFIYFANLILGAFCIDSNEMIESARKFLFNLILGDHAGHREDASLDDEIFKVASGLPDLCIVFGLVQYKLIAASAYDKIDDYNWLYENLRGFTGHRFNKPDIYWYVPSSEAQVDKTAWASISMSKVLGRFGFNQRRLSHYKKWALAFHLNRAFNEPLESYSAFKVLYVPQEYQYHLFEFTHELNLEFLKPILAKNDSVCWIDLGCGNGRNLEMLASVPDVFRNKITMDGLESRDDENLKQEFSYHFEKWFSQKADKHFIVRKLSEFGHENVYNIASATLMLHEINLEDLLPSLRCAINCLKNDGIIVIIDLVDYYYNESDIMTWELEEMKAIFELFNAGVEIIASDQEYHELRYTFMTIKHPYYLMVIRKLNPIPAITAEHDEKFQSILKSKMDGLKETRVQLENRMQEKINTVISLKTIERLKTPRQKREEITRILGQNESISKMDIEDIKNCFQIHQLEQQISAISKYIRHSVVQQT